MVLQISAAPDRKEEQKVANNHRVTRCDTNSRKLGSTRTGTTVYYNNN